LRALHNNPKRNYGPARGRSRGLRVAMAGFTLAELIVATTLLTLVMTAVYTAFHTTMRSWKGTEASLQTYQDARTALDVLSREVSCIIGGSEHLFEGDDDEFEFFAIWPPLNVEKGEGARSLWVRYHYNRSGKTLVRQEAFVKDSLPLRPRGDEEVETSRIKLGRKYKFVLASNVKKFEVSYYWIPKVQRRDDEPPEWVEPVVLDKNEKKWGLPQGLKVSLTVEDELAPSGEATFTSSVVFRGTTSHYDESWFGRRRDES